MIKIKEIILTCNNLDFNIKTNIIEVEKFWYELEKIESWDINGEKGKEIKVYTKNLSDKHEKELIKKLKNERIKQLQEIVEIINYKINLYKQKMQ